MMVGRGEMMVEREEMIELLGQTVSHTGPWVAFTIKSASLLVCVGWSAMKRDMNVDQDFTNSDCLPTAFFRTSLSSYTLLWEH